MVPESPKTSTVGPALKIVAPPPGSEIETAYLNIGWDKKVNNRSRVKRADDLQRTLTVRSSDG